MNTMLLLSSGGGLGGGFSWVSIAILVLMLVVMYFILIRPQKKQEKADQQMRNSLQVGDEIITIGGIIGEVVSIRDETLVLETSHDRTRIRILKSAVGKVNRPDDNSTPAKPEKADKKADKKDK